MFYGHFIKSGTLAYFINKTIFCPLHSTFFLKSFLIERYFVIRSASELSSVSPILASEPQEAVLSPAPFNLCSADQLTHPDTIVAEYADENVIYASLSDPIIASSYVITSIIR